MKKTNFHPITVALTCVGGRYSALMIDALRRGLGDNCIIIGLDKNPAVVNSAFCDYFYELPPATEAHNYIETLIALHNKHNINVLLPCSEIECKLLSENVELFHKKGLIVAVQDVKHSDLYTDKYKFFRFINDKKLATFPIFEVNSVAELQNALVNLNYPNDKVVLKSRTGTGSRGVIVIDSKISLFENYLEDRLCGAGDFNSVLKKVSNLNDFFNGLLAMPYYKGTTFDVDCIAKEGKLVSFACRERVYKNEFSPVNEGCVLRENKDIQNFLEKFCLLTNLHGCADFDITWSKNFGAIPLDVSMRMSGSIGCTLPLGLNLPFDLVSTLLNLESSRKSSQVIYNQLIIPSYQFFLAKKSPHEA